MQEEIDGMNRLIAGGLADIFRRLHPDETLCQIRSFSLNLIYKLNNKGLTPAKGFRIEKI